MRVAVKDATAGVHRRVDDLFSTLDLTIVGDYCHFIAANRLAHDRISGLFLANNTTHLSLPDLTRHLDRDLASLGITMPMFDWPEDAGALCPLGLGYVVIGSQFGAAVLRRRWARATHPLIRKSGAFLNCQTQNRFWPPLVAALAAAGQDVGAEIRCIASADCAFDVFESAFHITKDLREVANVA